MTHVHISSAVNPFWLFFPTLYDIIENEFPDEVKGYIKVV